jgi:hypothetical protein
MNTTDLKIAVTIPVAEALIRACREENVDQVTEILADVAFPNALAVILAAAIDPLLLLDADFQQVQYEHPALCYHAGRYENGERDLLAVHCYVQRQKISSAALAAGTNPRRKSQ